MREVTIRHPNLTSSNASSVETDRLSMSEASLWASFEYFEVFDSLD